MIVYHASKQEFIEDVFNGRIADNINDAFITYLGRHTSKNEITSWKNSMMHMYKVINTNEIPDNASIAIEYQIPLTSKRIDFIISGLDENNKENIIIIELKQWENAKLTNSPTLVITRFQKGEQATPHPSYQAWSYSYMLSNYNETVQKNQVILSPCAFLHNYSIDNVIKNDIYKEFINRAPIFLKSDAKKLQEFIKKHIKFGCKNDIIWQIDNGKLRPSKQLSDVLKSMLQGNKEFVLIDDQIVIYERAIELSKNIEKNKKQVFIVEGGPGTGKSVIAINLLVEFTKKRLTAQYVSKNAAPRDVYAAKLSGNFNKGYINNLFVGSGSFINTPEDSFDTLIIDEAHRLNMKSGLYSNLGNNQIKEIIKASKLSIFFVDDKQKIHIKDIGSRRSIEKYANELGATVHVGKLSSQFRCNGSDGYLNWLDNTLQISETANNYLSQDDYDFRIIENPNDLFELIKEKNKINNKARVVAGYCWDWNSKKNQDDFDIIIPEYNFKKRWNLNTDKNLWIIADNSVNEIGCIHTCQGLELDYIGVIVGNDMRFERNRVITDVTMRSSNDQSVKGFKSKLHKDEAMAIQSADEIIKNTYRTLMTRGTKGCYVYFCDQSLAKHFSNALKPLSLKKETRIEAAINDDIKYVDYLPIYSIKAACGNFGDGEIVEEIGWIKVDNIGKLNRNMFIVQAIGDSMEPIISNGDYCIFRANPAGSRQGKIILAQHFNHYDADCTGSYSIKIYTSKKAYDEFGNWSHENIVLEPKNPDFQAIVIEEEFSEEFRVIGEFIGKAEIN